MKVIFLVDMQSFYASIEKAQHPEYADQPLVVSGDPKRRSGVILAACPLAKSYGVKKRRAALGGPAEMSRSRHY